jgi:hypothetical protein
MASSVRSSAYAFVAEVARYLAVDPKDVKRMIELDALPASRIPKKKRTVERIYLPDFHQWILGRSSGQNDRLRDYPAFLAEFDRVARLHPEAEAA